MGRWRKRGKHGKHFNQPCRWTRQQQLEAAVAAATAANGRAAPPSAALPHLEPAGPIVAHPQAAVRVLGGGLQQQHALEVVYSRALRPACRRDRPGTPHLSEGQQAGQGRIAGCKSSGPLGSRGPRTVAQAVRCLRSSPGPPMPRCDRRRCLARLPTLPAINSSHSCSKEPTGELPSGEELACSRRGE